MTTQLPYLPPIATEHHKPQVSPAPPAIASRSRRRGDLQRMKAKSRRLYPHDKNGKLANHLAECSCPMCGNPRRHFKQKTIQEQRAEQAQ